MSLDLTLQRSIYVMVLVASVILAVAEGTLSPECASPVILLVAYFFHERRQNITLGDFAAGLCGIGGFGLALAELLTGGIEARILSGTHLLVYFSWVVLFMRKRSQQWWWLAALSVLQIAVASVLKPSGWYGVALVGFAILSIWTLAVFSLYRANRQFAFTQNQAASVVADRASTENAAWWLSSVKAVSSDSGSSANREHPDAWTSQSRGAIQLDGNESWVSRRFVLSTISSSFGMLAIGLFVFLLVPRIGWKQLGAQMHEEKDEAVQLSGFTDEVRLGDITNILESTAPALRVKVMNSVSGEYIDINQFANSLGYAEPLFRGTVHGAYSNGVWSKLNIGGGQKRVQATIGPKYFVQEYELEPIAGRILFAIHPIRRCEVTKPRSPSHMLSTRGVLIRPDVATSTIVYKTTTNQVDRTYSHAVPFQKVGLSQGGRRQHTKLPRGLNRLIDEARRIVDYDNNPDVQQKIDRLLNYLQSGEFQYSLDLVRSDAVIDPVEDFVFNHKTGHCEYFASTFALMLRAVDVPTRLVTGFKGGDYNPETHVMTVKQLHAHSWVEVLMETGDRSRDWVVYDPTPADEQTELVDMIAARPVSLFDTIQRVAAQIWQSYIVNITLTRQRELLYDPIRDTVLNIYESVVEFGPIIGLWRIIVDLFTNPDRWFSWSGWISTFVVLSFLAGLMTLIRRVYLRLKRRIFGTTDLEERVLQTIRFYVRFRDICEQLGLVQRVGQTAGEFAICVHAAIREVTSSETLLAVPGDVTRSFYDVRFGNRVLATTELSQLDSNLRELEELLISNETAAHA